MRKILLSLCAIVCLLSGCSDNNQKEVVKDNEQLSEKYLNLMAMDISNEDQLVKLFEKETKEAKTRDENVVIVGKDEVLKDYIQSKKKTVGSYQEMYEKIINAAAEIDVDDFFKTLSNRNEKILKTWTKDKSAVDSYEAYSDLFVMSDEAYLINIPDEHPYNVFAYLPIGNYNECPSSEQLLAVFKHWYENYGIIPAVVTYDSVQITFTKTLTDEQIEQLAEEFLLLNPEVQSMEYPTKEDLVKGLKHSKYWMFWWD